jgi:hypothetical protein
VEANDETTEERSHGRFSRYVAIENIKISIEAPIAPTARYCNILNLRNDNRRLKSSVILVR